MARTTKTAAAAGSPEREPGEPRRSSRIKAQPPPPAPPKKKPAKPRAKKAKDAGEKKTGDKREAEEENGDEPEKKKPGTETVAEEGDEEDEVKELEIGGLLPDITLQNEKGEDVSIRSLAADKGLVLFLFPKADTPGCTKQACGFGDVYKEFEEAGYNVYGLSTDAGTATLKWQTKKSLPYSFLSDPKKELITALGAGGGKTAKRSHFVFAKGGALIDRKLPVKPEESPKLALEFIKGYKPE
ncbi:AhpC-TSA-domain-containing protein [Auricularia subglabra TFB-10046 SS5]|nr:AhpC-TSA-domain-containing protein [Auricularia subglabra TFB-10046 SS5]